MKSAVISCLVIVSMCRFAGVAKGGPVQVDNTDEWATSAPAPTSADATDANSSALSALSAFAASLNEHGDVWRAAKQYAEVLSAQGMAHLKARTSIATQERAIASGMQLTFEIQIDFEPVEVERYEWKWALFEVSTDGRRYLYLSSGGGQGHRNMRSIHKVVGPSDAPGDVELFFVVFGRSLPNGTFDYLDSLRIRYAVHAQ